MAKENKKAPEATTEVTAENVMEQIRNKNLMPEGIAEEVTKEIEEEERNAKKSDLKDAILRASCENCNALISLRKQRHEEKHLKTYLEKTKSLLDDLKTGKLTVVEYNKAIQSAKDEKRKGYDEVQKEYSDNIKELRNSNPNFRWIMW